MPFSMNYYMCIDSTSNEKFYMGKIMEIVNYETKNSAGRN